MINTKEWGEFPEGMRCLFKTLWKLKFLIAGVLTSWALSPSFAGNEYILVAVDYVSKWVEAVATPRNDAKTVVKFIKKNIFARFRVLGF